MPTTHTKMMPLSLQNDHNLERCITCNKTQITLLLKYHMYPNIVSIIGPDTCNTSPSSISHVSRHIHSKSNNLEQGNYSGICNVVSYQVAVTYEVHARWKLRDKNVMEN